MLVHFKPDSHDLNNKTDAILQQILEFILQCFVPQRHFCFQNVFFVPPYAECVSVGAK